MLKLPPQKYQCPRCGFSKTFFPSDCNPLLIGECPKCHIVLKKVHMNFWDKLKLKIRIKF